MTQIGVACQLAPDCLRKSFNATPDQAPAPRNGKGRRATRILHTIERMKLKCFRV